MRVAVIVPKNPEGHVRGGHVQINKTIEVLKTMGVKVIVRSSVSELDESVDVCHIVGIQDSKFALNEVKLAKKFGARAVVSTIWWDFDKLMLEEGWASTLENGRARWVALSRLNSTMARSVFFLRYRWNNMVSNRRRAVACRLADLLLPNSPGEAAKVITLAGRTLPYVSVRNGVDEDLFRIVEPRAVRDVPLLFVGIVDRTKNVHRLIQAINVLRIKLTVVGQCTDTAYRSYCDELDNGHLVDWMGRLSHDELVKLYNRSRVVILCSMRETPGLTLLEGAACGANVVATEIGSTKEYFGNYAEYCDPLSVKSIANAIERALPKTVPNEAFSNFIRQNFTWRHAGRDTVEGYQRVLPSLYKSQVTIVEASGDA